jgi:hypothetical protein
LGEILMHETFGERVTEKVYGGAPWEVKFYKDEAKNAIRYLKYDKRMIEAFKRKYPHDWKKRIGGYVYDIRFYKNQEKSSKAKIRRWEAIQKFHKKLRGVV